MKPERLTKELAKTIIANHMKPAKVIGNVTYNPDSDEWEAMVSCGKIVLMAFKITEK
jgi:hypothetical protein